MDISTLWDNTGLDETNQDSFSFVCLLLGVVVSIRGALVVRPLYMVAGAWSLGALTYRFCEHAEQMGGASVPWIGAILAAMLSVELLRLLYPAFLFLVGSLLGATIVLLPSMVASDGPSPASLLGLAVLSSLMAGLLFKRFSEIHWRIVTPPAGAILLTASVRCILSTFILRQDVLWSSFKNELSPENGPGAVVFLLSWVVFSALGWYSQLAPILGQPDPFVLPAWAVTLSMKFHEWLPFLFDEVAASKKSCGGDMNEPLLFGEGFQSFHSVVKDYRPEFALIMAIVSILILNVALATKPLLFIGHAVLMSAAFLPLASAGMITYASPNLLLPSLFDPRSDDVLPRHFTHAAFNALAVVCAVAGYACIWASHSDAGVSQVGWDAPVVSPRRFHVFNGYAILALMIVQASAGAVKLFGLHVNQEDRARFHGTLGRVVYCLAALNQLVGYFVPGLIPTWLGGILGVMLIATVSSTLFFLEARGRSGRRRSITAASRQHEHCHSLTSARSTVSGGTAGGLHSPRTSVSDASKPEHVQRPSAYTYFEKQSARALLSRVFTDWHREIQALKLAKASAAMESQDRLVQFLSVGLAGDNHCTGHFTDENLRNPRHSAPVPSGPSKDGVLRSRRHSEIAPRPEQDSTVSGGPTQAHGKPQRLCISDEDSGAPAEPTSATSVAITITPRLPTSNTAGPAAAKSMSAPNATEVAVQVIEPRSANVCSEPLQGEVVGSTLVGIEHMNASHNAHTPIANATEKVKSKEDVRISGSLRHGGGADVASTGSIADQLVGA